MLGHKVTKFTPYNFSPLYYLLPPFAHNLSQLLITHNPLDRLPSPPDQVDSGQRVVWRVRTKCTTVHWRVWTARLHHKGALLSAQSGRRLSRGTHPTPLVSISYSTHAGLVCHSIDMCYVSQYTIPPLWTPPPLPLPHWPHCNTLAWVKIKAK